MTSSDKLQGGQPAPLTLRDAVKAHDWQAARGIIRRHLVDDCPPGCPDCKLPQAVVGTPTGCRVPGCTMTRGAHERTYLELETTHGPRTADDFAWRHRWGEP